LSSNARVVRVPGERCMMRPRCRYVERTLWCGCALCAGVYSGTRSGFCALRRRGWSRSRHRSELVGRRKPGRRCRAVDDRGSLASNDGGPPLGAGPLSARSSSRRTVVVAACFGSPEVAVHQRYPRPRDHWPRRYREYIHYSLSIWFPISSGADQQEGITTARRDLLTGLPLTRISLVDSVTASQRRHSNSIPHSTSIASTQSPKYNTCACDNHSCSGRDVLRLHSHQHDLSNGG